MRKRGFYCRNTKETILWLLVCNRCKWIEKTIGKDIIRQIASCFVYFIDADITTVNNGFQRTNTFQDNAVNQWIKEENSSITLIRRTGATNIMGEMVLRIPDKFSVLVVCNSVRNAFNLRGKFSIDMDHIVVVEPGGLMYVDPDNYDFVFCDNVNVECTPRKKLFTIKTE